MKEMTLQETELKTELRVLVRAPSNIAVVKYMGKEDAQSNLPSNGSLSLTLNTLATDALFVRTLGEQGVRWSSSLEGPLMAAFSAKNSTAQLSVPQLDDRGKARIERHVLRVLDLGRAVLKAHHIDMFEGINEFGIEFCAGNTFPASSGIASSASSFAAVTLGTVVLMVRQPEEFQKRLEKDAELRRDLAAISRQGSGSSCRSFEGPWVKWEETQAQKVFSKMREFTDFVIVVGKTPKDVSSSEAHLRVKKSPLWDGRVQRVTERLGRVQRAIEVGDQVQLAQDTWAEMWEMHSLFHTATPAFTYWLPDSLAVLKPLLKWVEQPEQAGLRSSLVVTMDAGPNIHCLVPTEEAPQFRHALVQLLKSHVPQAEILEDREGSGACVLKVERRTL